MRKSCEFSDYFRAISMPFCEKKQELEMDSLEGYWIKRLFIECIFRFFFNLQNLTKISQNFKKNFNFRKFFKTFELLLSVRGIVLPRELQKKIFQKA